MKNSLSISRRIYGMLAAIVFVQTTQVFAQEKIRVDLMIGETERNLVIFRIQQKTIEDLKKDLRLVVDAPGGKPAELVLFAVHVKGDEIVSVEASETLKFEGQGEQGQPIEPAAKFTGEMIYPGQVLRDQKVIRSTSYPVIPWDVASRAYGLVAPRRDSLAPNRLKSLVLPGVAQARKANDARKADALVLFVTGAAECGEDCAIESQIMTFLLEPKR